MLFLDRHITVSTLTGSATTEWDAHAVYCQHAPMIPHLNPTGKYYRSRLSSLNRGGGGRDKGENNVVAGR
jgi:hypothetical protein